MFRILHTLEPDFDVKMHFSRAARVNAGGTFAASKLDNSSLTADDGSNTVQNELFSRRVATHYRCFAQHFYQEVCREAYSGLSENLNFEILDNIANEVRYFLERHDPEMPPVKVIYLTHGTDAMEQTARYLQAKLRDLIDEKKAIVIMLGSNHPLKSKYKEPWKNLGFALQVGTCYLKESDTYGLSPGVYVAFHDRLIHADEVVKEPFNGREMNYISKYDPAYLPLIRNEELRCYKRIQKLQDALGFHRWNGDTVLEYPVNVIRPNHDQLFREITPETKATLFTLYHSGTANADDARPDLSVAKLVEKLRKDHGIVCFGATENGEPTDLKRYETSVKLLNAGLVPLYNMHRLVVLGKLRICAGRTENPTHLILNMLKNQSGEINMKRINLEDISELVKLYGGNLQELLKKTK